MLVSLCLPVHNRLDDLKVALPKMIEEAATSPPMEIAIVNYASSDKLYLYLYDLVQSPLPTGVAITARRYEGHDYFHMAHARNLSVLASHGEYFIIWSADLTPQPGFFSSVRTVIEHSRPTWFHPKGETEIIICKRLAFWSAGGYDERFEFYGPEGKELHSRLTRRYGKPLVTLNKPFKKITKSDNHRFDNYRLSLGKREMFRIGKAILDENEEKQLLKANPKGWGSWS